MTKIFVNCEHCGKKLIEKQEDGRWYFAFGKSNNGSNIIPVEIYAMGAIKIKCLRKSCHKWNIFNNFSIEEEV